MPDVNQLASVTYVEICPHAEKWAAAVLADAPTSWWRMGAVKGTNGVPDEIGALDAVSEGSPASFAVPSRIATHVSEPANRSSTLNANGYWDRYGGAYTLDGIDDAFRVADATDLDPGTGDFTVEVVLWFNPTTGTTGERFIVWKGARLTAGYYLSYDYTADRLRFRVDDGVDVATADWASTGLRTASKHSVNQTIPLHIVCTRTATTIAIWVNGVQRATAGASTVGSLNNGEDLRIGDDDLGNVFADTIDEVAWYKGTAVSSPRIAVHFDAVRWLDVTEDIRRHHPFVVAHGIQGNQPVDLVASPGSAVFALDNSDQNAAGLEGYFSPGHANALANLGDGTLVRIGVQHTGVSHTQWLFLGAVSDIVPSSDPRDPVSIFTAGDFFYDALEERLTRAPAVINGTASDIVEDTLIDQMEAGPYDKRTWPTSDVLPIALDDLPESESTYLRAFQAMAQSDYLHLYMRAQSEAAANGPQVVVESRAARLAKQAPVHQIVTDEMETMEVTLSKANVINHVDVTYRRRAFGETTVVLAALRDSTPGAEPETAIAIAPGKTREFHLAYTNPDDRQERVGGVDVLTPVSGTDYGFFASPEGTGIDLTSDLTLVSFEGGGTSALAEVRNDGAVLGYVTQFDVRGVMVQRDEPITIERRDAASIAAVGDRPLTPAFDMPYQATALLPAGLADYVILLRGDQFTDVPSVSVPALFQGVTGSPALGIPIMWEIGERIRVTGARAGIARDFFVQSIRLDFVTDHWIMATFGLTPAADLPTPAQLRDVSAGLATLRDTPQGDFVLGYF